MNIDAIVNQIDTEKIYEIVTDLEGPRYPLDNMGALNEAGDYIIDKLKSYGIKVEIQEFYVDSMDEPFRNIIGFIGDQCKPAILIGSHYDTVRNSPGANDNLSGVAVSLEVARVLNQMKNPPSVIVGVFTLEEGHPGIAKQVQKKLLEHGMIDSKHRLTSARMLKFKKMLFKASSQKTREGKKIVEALMEIGEDLKTSLEADEKQYIDVLIDVYGSFLKKSPNDMLHYPIGSYEFANRIKSDGTKIKNVIVYDCLGWIKNEANTQNKIPISNDMNQFLKLHKVDKENSVGNYIVIVGEKNSTPLLNKFLNHCESEELDIPYYGIDIPLEYPEIKKIIPDVLRSDHAAFWKAGIPGIFISDTANFRSDFYHTAEDTSYNMDYDSLQKVAQVTVKTILSMVNEK